MEGGGDYVGWELCDDGSRGSPVEGERGTTRRVAMIRNDESDGGKTDEDAGGYIGVYATLGIEKRRDRPATL